MNNKLSTKLKTNSMAIILVLLMATVMLMANKPVEAQTTLPAGVTPTNLQTGGSILLPAGVTPGVTIDTTAYLSFSPNPIGVGQSLLVNFWIVPPLHVSHYFTGYTVTITKPDGTKDVKVLNSLYGDTTGWFSYVVDQVGNYSLQFNFPGGYFPPGNYSIAPGSALYSATTTTYVNFVQSSYYAPSSTPEQTLTVQTAPVLSWPPAPLPTDYWTPPVSPNNREWWPILGNYPGTGYIGGGTTWDELYPNTNPNYSPTYNFIPWVQGPNSAHIVWRNQEMEIGLIGGQVGQYTPSSGPGSPTPSTPGVIYSGRCYQTVTKSLNGGAPTSYAECYNLQTGQIYYNIATSAGGVTPTIVAYPPAYATISGEAAVPGGTAGAGWNVDLISISGGYLIKVDPFTGAVLTNVSISPLTGSGGTYYMNNYVLAVQSLGSNNYALINWTTVGTSSTFASRIISNTTYAMSSLPGLIDFNAGLGATVTGITSPASGTPLQTNIIGYNLETGQQLWNVTVNEINYTPGCNVADHGRVAVLMMDGYYDCWDLKTGNLVWKSELMDYPWGQASFGAYAVQSAYGLIFREAYDGVYAFNWTNGDIAWHCETPTPAAFETPYIDNGTSVYSFQSGGEVADGKLFVFNNEHTPTLPLARGYCTYAINVTTGKIVWSIDAYATPGAVAFGYLTAGSAYDGYMYVFGKGQSATAVTAPLTTVPQGTSVLIQGTVMDESPATTTSAYYAPGQPVPCVSDASMSTWMEYLYMQAPIGGIWGNATITGVPVTLTATSSTGTVYNIGTVTTNGYFGTFTTTWTPPAAGLYTISAVYAGDDSYGSSAASTGLSVAAPVATPTPTPTATPPSNLATQADLMTYIVAVGIAIIIAIAIVGALILRKHA